MKVYPMLKTYSDGVTVRVHVSVPDAAAAISYIRTELTAPVFPFATVEVFGECDNAFTCTHHLVPAGTGATYRASDFVTA